MEFRILGPLEVLDDEGAGVAVGGSRERALLTLLLASANRVVSSERLADDLWGDHPPEGAAHALQVHVSRLRKVLRDAGADGVLVTRAPGYSIRVDPAAVDAGRFEALLAQAGDLVADGDHSRAAATLREALSLWRGPALADVADAPLARAEAARLDGTRLAALEDRVEADLACGRHAQLAAELDAVTRAHPLRERLWGQRMVALYRAGRQAEALRAYQDLRAILGEQLGLEPNPTLQRLEGAILRHEAILDWPPAGMAQPPPGVAVLRSVGRSPAIPMPALLTEIGRVFVGRAPELGQLEGLWTETAAGGRHLALLSGEPGIGKTRLAAEIAGRVHAEGSTVLSGRCDEDLGVPYQPFVEALRHFVEHTPAAQLAAGLGRHAGELARIHPDLAERVAGLAPPLRSDPETERYRLFEAVAAWLATASAHPVLLVLDDLQWATKPTLLLLRHVMRSPEPVRLLILGLYRDTEVSPGHPLVEMLADFRRQAGVERLPLCGLDQTEVARFMAQAAGHEMDDDGLALARIIHSETEGNPFFVREVIRHLTETGDIERRDGRWGSRLPVDELGVPEGVREVVGRRLARLSAGAHHVLRVAAVAGPEFELAVIGAAGPLDEETLLSAVEEAVAARLLTEVAGPRPRYRFAHALVRDTLYGDLSAARRAAIHRAVAEAIEAVHAALDDHLPALAHHWARAAAPVAETARAVDYATRAGNRALDQLAHDEAAAYYASALELLDAAGAEADDPGRLELLISRGEAQRRAGDAAHRQTLLDAARLAAGRGDGNALARAALANSRGHLYTASFEVDADRVDMLEAAIAATGEDDLAVRARLLAILGLELSWETDPQRRMALSDEALHVARQLGDHRTLAHVLVARNYTITSPDNVGERMAATTELLALAESLGDPVVTSRALLLRFRTAIELADVAEAERSLARNQTVVADLGQPGLAWSLMIQHAGLTLLRGDLAAAEVEIFAAHDHGTARSQPDAVAWFVAQQFSLRFEQGRLAEMEDSIEAVFERTRSPGVKALYGTILAETDRWPEAGRVFDELASTGFAAPTNNVMWLRFAAECAFLCARLERPASAPKLRSMLEPYAGQVVQIGLGGTITGSVAHYLGLLAATTAKWDDAEAHFAAAAQTHQAMGARPWLARTQLERAAALLGRRHPGDAEQSQQLLGEALATATELGLANVERRALALVQPVA